MKKFLFFICVSFFTPVIAFAQGYIGIYDGLPYDSVTIRPGIDSLTSPSNATDFLTVDTSGTTLWTIGNTSKTFFADSATVTGIMTDSVNPYPVNANDWFTVKLNAGFNTILDFWHKYQTTPGHDGGIVEFSTDSGLTWQNIQGPCNTDSFGFSPGIKTDNFYAATDTLQDGEAAFTGSSNGEIFSRLQFFTGVPLKTTDTACEIHGTVLVRFRFVSDSVADSLDGWIIEGIKLEDDYYSSVPNIQVNKLHIYPNPSTDGQFIFPVIKDEKNYTIEVTNVLGKTLFKVPYTHNVNLSQYAKGIYFYKVTNSTEYYTGQLITQ